MGCHPSHIISHCSRWWKPPTSMAINAMQWFGMLWCMACYGLMVCMISKLHSGSCIRCAKRSAISGQTPDQVMNASILHIMGSCFFLEHGWSLIPSPVYITQILNRPNMWFHLLLHHGLWAVFNIRGRGCKTIISPGNHYIPIVFPYPWLFSHDFPIPRGKGFAEHSFSTWAEQLFKLPLENLLVAGVFG